MRRCSSAPTKSRRDGRRCSRSWTPGRITCRTIFRIMRPAPMAPPQRASFWPRIAVPGARCNYQTDAVAMSPDAREPGFVIVTGVSWSGKSTIGGKLAVSLNWDYEDADWFHPQANVEKMHRGQPLTDE